MSETDKTPAPVVPIIPQDDDPTLGRENDCDCSFTPYEDSDEESWHYLRRCSVCGETWYSLHCKCECRFIRCGSCRTLTNESL